MKRICAVAVIFAVLISAALIPSTAAENEDEKMDVRLCFILNHDSISGCSGGNSYFDNVILAADAAGQKIAFFFDCSDMVYDKDFASAIMKIYTRKMPFGIYESSASSSEKDIANAVIHQKYVTKTVSRLALINAGDVRYDDKFSVYEFDILVSSESMIYEMISPEFYRAGFAAVINARTSAAFVSFFEDFDDKNIRILTPTETGYIFCDLEG